MRRRPAMSLGGFFRDLRDALQWLAVIVPPAFGFWVVTSEFVGLSAADRQLALSSALLAVGVLTLVQVAMGYRFSIFEGPGSVYFAILAVTSATTVVTPSMAFGGLLISAAVILLVAVSAGARRLGMLFTAPVTVVFMVAIVVAAGPATLGSALEVSERGPGTLAGWLTLVVVVAVAYSADRNERTRAFSLVLALVLGVAVYGALSGLPTGVGGGAGPPRPFPWGPPEFVGFLVLPYALAGVLGAFNAIAAIRAIGMMESAEHSMRPVRRGLVMHGLGQAFNAGVYGLMGTVPRIDSAVVASSLPRRARQSLMVAAVLLIGGAFVGPLVRVFSMIPVSASGALLTAVLLALLRIAVGQARGMSREVRRSVVYPALAPAILWLFLSPWLVGMPALLLNPLFTSVFAAVLLDAVRRRRQGPRVSG